MITFVLYFVHFDPSEREKDPFVFKEKAKSQEKMIAYTFESIKHTHPNCKLLFVTDSATQIALPEGVEIVRHEIDRKKLLFCSFKSYVSLLKTVEDSTHFVFVDYDMIVQKNLEHVFEKPFDVGLCFREHPAVVDSYLMPIIGSPIFVSQKGRERAIEFFQKNIETMLLKYPKYLMFWAIQMALIDTLTHKKLTQAVLTDEEFLTVEKTRIRLLPCDSYSFFDNEHEEKMWNFHPDKQVVHFKGDHAKMMLHYWEEYY